MASPIRIRLRLSGDRLAVRVAITHEMESGLRLDAAGKTIAARYIQTVKTELNGKEVLSVDLGPNVARNPNLDFSLKGAKQGDTVKVSWTDNQGGTRSDTAAVA